MNLKTLILTILFIIFTPLTGFAQDLKNAPPKEVIREQKLQNIELDLSPSLNLKLSGFDVFPDYWNSYVKKPKIYYITKYEGFESVIHNQIKRLAMKYYNQELSISQQNQDDVFFKDKINETYLDFERPNKFEYYTDYLLMEKGGSHYEENIIGKELEIIKIWQYGFTNTGKIKINENGN